ncbi:hypothetical protein [Streptomyces spiralis]|uniref:hypothetical protein n=1 Tax=Streptomyces spiralis TaxID=66376 RepID=UPI003675B967
MTWLRAFGEVVRSGLTIEETRLGPLLALRTAAGVAIVIGPALRPASPAYARLPLAPRGFGMPSPRGRSRRPLDEPARTVTLAVAPLGVRAGTVAPSAAPRG